MPSAVRLTAPGALFTVSAHADQGEKLFHDDGDRRAWLRVLAEVCAVFGWRIHAFCQMHKQYRLLLATPAPHLGAGMLHLDRLYAQRWQERRHRDAALLQRHFQVHPLQRRADVPELVRDVLLAPVRAGMVATPGGWPWSSYLLTCDAAMAPPWLDTAWVLAQFADGRAEAVKAFRRFVADGCAAPQVGPRMAAEK
jgi:putative transposase